MTTDTMQTVAIILLATALWLQSLGRNGRIEQVERSLQTLWRHSTYPHNYPNWIVRQQDVREECLLDERRPYREGE